jgi:predicted GH43/DUF377 family glycosyl hydrolase
MSDLETVENNKQNVVGVFEDGGIVYLFYKSTDSSDLLSVEAGSDGQNFTKFKSNIKLVDDRKRRINSSEILHFNVSKIFDNYMAAFEARSDGKRKLFCAAGRDFDGFATLSEIEGIKEGGVLVPNYKYDGKYVLFFGGATIRMVYSANFLDWQKHEEPVVKSYKDFFGENPLKVGNIFVTDEGLLLIYFVIKSKNGINHFELKAVVCDKNNPAKVLRHIENHIWESPDEWFGEKVKPLGVVKVQENLISYWKGEKGLYSVLHASFLFDEKKKHFPHILLHKLKHNPILRPIIENLWESKATFNPAAIFDEEKVHIIYRAIGQDDVSVLGYASSRDGLHIDERLAMPIFVPTQPFESSGPYRGHNLGKFTSGGGCFGGCEDPRITKIDDRLYMTYVAYDGWNPPRVALTSIDFGDFLDHRFDWEKPVLISKPGVVDKNACLLPEKINGKFVIFHRIFPDILVDYVDDLNFDGTRFLEGRHKIKPRESHWDSRKIGVGAPPIKTDEGWLLIYQAVGEKDSSRYHMGAMLLDHDDPTRVIARSHHPILSPDMWFENEGHKAGVAYPCGAVNMHNNLYVYYGGADTVVCVAGAKTDQFVANLKKHKPLELSPMLIS